MCRILTSTYMGGGGGHEGYVCVGYIHLHIGGHEGYVCVGYIHLHIGGHKGYVRVDREDMYVYI